jgi:hypothetical protein
LVVREKRLKIAHKWEFLTPAKADIRNSNAEDIRCFTAENLMDLADIVIGNTYFWVGQAVAKQTVGNPMGAHPSPAFADLFLYMDELAFMRQFTQSLATWDFFYKNFAFISRFQDDIVALAAPSFQRALYKTRRWGADNDDTRPADVAVAPGYPYCGIYPSSLNIAIEQDNRHVDGDPGKARARELVPVHHQDVLIFFRSEMNQDGTVTSRFICKVYDKKIKLMAEGAQLIFYPHATTMLSDQCKYGIVYSQCHRYYMRCTLLKDFQEACKILIETLATKKNYKIKMCIKEVRRFTLKYAHIYDARVPGKVLAAIVAHFRSNRFDAWQ